MRPAMLLALLSAIAGKTHPTARNDIADGSFTSKDKSNPLRQHFYNVTSSDPGIWKWRHYFRTCACPGHPLARPSQRSRDPCTRGVRSRPRRAGGTQGFLLVVARHADHKHFERFRGTDVHLTEIGIYLGGSMRMWRWYFGERAHITGVDIEPATRVYQGNPRFGRPDQIVIGDQSDPAFWERFKREVCGRGGLWAREMPT